MRRCVCVCVHVFYTYDKFHRLSHVHAVWWRCLSSVHVINRQRSLSCSLARIFRLWSMYCILYEIDSFFLFSRERKPLPYIHNVASIVVVPAAFKCVSQSLRVCACVYLFGFTSHWHCVSALFNHVLLFLQSFRSFRLKLMWNDDHCCSRVPLCGVHRQF